MYFRPEDLQKVLLTYDHLALGRRRSDNAIVAMTVVRAEIDVIDGKRYNLIRVNSSTCTVPCNIYMII